MLVRYRVAVPFPYPTLICVPERVQQPIQKDTQIIGFPCISFRSTCFTPPQGNEVAFHSIAQDKNPGSAGLQPGARIVRCASLLLGRGFFSLLSNCPTPDSLERKREEQPTKAESSNMVGVCIGGNYEL